MIVCKIFQHSPVFRIGGDEFVVILTGGDFEQRYELLAQLDRQIEENIPKNDAVISAGLSDYISGSDMNFHTVFERADALMYTRKKELKSMGAKTR